MTTEIKNLQFADGVEVAAPFEFAKLANKLQPFVDDAAFEAANGPGVEGSIYLEDGTGNIRVHNGTTWEYFIAAGALPVDAGAPIGTIVPMFPGYYSSNSNGGFNLVGPTTNDVAGINAFLPSNWRVCDGSELNDPASPIFNGAGRYLPRLTDQRFVMGYTQAGLSGDGTAGFLGDAISRLEWFKNANYTPSGSVSTTVTFNKNVMNSNFIQHGHNSGSYGVEGHLRSDQKFRMAYRSVASYIGKYGNSTNIGYFSTGGTSWTTGMYINGSSSTSYPTWSSSTAQTSESSSFSGNAVAIRTTFGNNLNYTPSGTITNVTPNYVTGFYIMRVK